MGGVRQRGSGVIVFLKRYPVQDAYLTEETQHEFFVSITQSDCALPEMDVRQRQTLQY